MADSNFNPYEDQFIRSLIRRKAKKLIGRAGFTRDDREDLEQDLVVRILQSTPKFDPEKAHLYGFLTAVVDRHCRNLLRNKRAAKRDYRRIGSLNVMVKDTEEESTELVQIISQRELDARFGRDSRADEDVANLKMDMAVLIARLPEPWQRLLELRKTLTMTEASGAMDIPRTTLNDCMRRIRQRFEDAGLRDCL